MARTAPRKWIRYSLLGVGVLIVIALVVAVIKSFLAQSGKPRKPSVQQIAILRPPPPPPPPKQEEKPPEIKKEEVKLPPPPEEAPKAADNKEAGKNLGVDAEGSAGGDGFGLVGSKGGRDYLAGDGGARSQFAFYTNMIQQQIQDELSRNKKLKGGDYRVVVRIWLGTDGRMQKVDLAGSTGNADVDVNLRSALAEMTFRQPPPQNMPQPVRLRISSRGAG